MISQKRGSRCMVWVGWRRLLAFRNGIFVFFETLLDKKMMVNFNSFILCQRSLFVQHTRTRTQAVTSILNNRIQLRAPASTGRAHVILCDWGLLFLPLQFIGASIDTDCSPKSREIIAKIGVEKGELCSTEQLSPDHKIMVFTTMKSRNHEVFQTQHYCNNICTTHSTK